MATNTKKILERLAPVIPIIVIGIVAVFTFLISSVMAGGISPNEVIKYVNRAREDAGLPPVKENALLSRAAEAKARDMIKDDYFAHTSPDGKTPWVWLKDIGYRYKTAGENLAINYSSAKEQHNAWMKSTTHRANILNGKYTEIGVAVVQGKIDDENSMVTVQFFGAPMVVAADRTTPVTPVPEQVVAPTPAIQGEKIEISTPEESQPAPLLEEKSPVSTPSLMPPQVNDRLASALELGTLITVIVLALALILSPLSILLMALLSLSIAIWSKRAIQVRMVSEEAVPIKIRVLHTAK